MNIVGKCTVFNKEVARPDGTVWNQYTISISKKINDEWKNVYIPANFKKGVLVVNKSKIEVTNGWLDFYINKDNKSVLTAFISEFDMIEGVSEKPSNIFETLGDPEGLPW